MLLLLLLLVLNRIKLCIFLGGWGFLLMLVFELPPEILFHFCLIHVDVRKHIFEKRRWKRARCALQGGIGPGNNHPYRGHKHDAWEGGTRVTSFISGGVVPAALRGTRNRNSVVHIIDWWATLSVLAGVEPVDDVWFEGAVRPVDAVDVWPMLMGTNNTAPRPWTYVGALHADPFTDVRSILIVLWHIKDEVRDLPKKLLL